MPEPRRYRLQNEGANALIEQVLETAEVPADQRPWTRQLLTTVLKLHEDGARTGDLKITNAALKELRYGYKVFAPYQDVPKVTVFGSARTPRSEPTAEAACHFGQRMVQAGWMVVTGAGAGIMGAAQEGAGAERSFGLNIRLPFEQEANPWIAADPKLMSFKYFFTRKLFLVKEASAVAMFPGGFGTMDETFELLTLMQTGKSPIVPVVLVETGPVPYWRRWDAWVREVLVEGGFIHAGDTSLYRVVDGVDAAVGEILGFYRTYHSMRIVGDRLVFRLRAPLEADRLEALRSGFADCLTGNVEQAPGPLRGEWEEYPDLPRLVLPFNRASYARLRQLIDWINER